MRTQKIITIIVCCVLCAVAIAGALALMESPKVVLELVGEQNITVEYGNTYEDAGANAFLRGNLFLKKGKPIAEVLQTNDFDSTKLGSYTYTYTAKALGKTNELKRTVTIVDTKKPEITLLGEAEISLYKGEKFEDAGAKASDNYNGDITASIKTEGTVDTDTVGEYTLTYTVNDQSNNSASVTRKVTVKKKPTVQQSAAPSDSVTVNPGKKVVYLTFDDGPGPYTEKLLNVLDKYSVKATFFVTNNNPGYNHLFKRMANSGHALAIHTATHNYRKIYASEDAFFADVYKMQNIIKEQTGITTYLLRFPGGSSNTTSSFNKGIMSRLVKAVTDKGFRYFDWNVTSGDAGETTSTAQIVRNVTNGMASHSVSVVLQHDIKGFSVDAVEQIIKWGLDNGYTFKACDMTSPTAHHGINN